MVGAIHLVDTPLGAWGLLIALFVLGSFFGSFANVVIYRLPLGQSLLWPGSHCPVCGHPIRWYDNVPVFGWLTLNGRCRDCHAQISVRYPLVESLFGALLAALGWLEIVDARGNLPHTPVADGTSPASDWAQVAYHLLLLGTLIVAALIEHDGRRIPRRLLLFTLLLGISLPLAWSGLRPVPLGVELPASVEGQDAWRVLLEGLAGIGAAAALGLSGLAVARTGCRTPMAGHSGAGAGHPRRAPGLASRLRNCGRRVALRSAGRARGTGLALGRAHRLGDVARGRHRRLAGLLVDAGAKGAGAGQRQIGTGSCRGGDRCHGVGRRLSRSPLDVRSSSRGRMIGAAAVRTARKITSASGRPSPCPLPGGRGVGRRSYSSFTPYRREPIRNESSESLSPNRSPLGWMTPASAARSPRRATSKK